MAIAGKAAARGLRSKGVKANDMKSSAASRKTKIAYTKLKKKPGGFS
jgi:hypothetical protein